MSARRDIQFTWNPHNKATIVDCSFIVDSANANGLGIRSLKGSGRVAKVFMHSSDEEGAFLAGNPNPVSGPGSGSVDLGTAANFAIGAYAAIIGSTGSGSVVNGNMFITPDTLTSVTNFPPSVDNGVIHAADSAAVQAMIDATAAFVAMNALNAGATGISANLGGQTLAPGTYKESGAGSPATFHLANSGPETLTFNGAGTYIFLCASTLDTGAGGMPTMAFSGGATPSNTFIYWVVGSAATINIGVTASGGVFYGTVIASAAITATQPGTINGRLISLTAAVTLSDTNTVNGAGASGGGGGMVVILNDNYNRYLGGYSGCVCPVSGSTITSGLSVGSPYVIVSVGASTTAQWLAAGLPLKITPAVGVSFIAAATSVAGGGAVQAPKLGGSGIDHIEVIGNANLMNNMGKYEMEGPQADVGNGMMFVLQCFSNGVPVQPADGTVIGLNFYLNNSVQGV